MINDRIASLKNELNTAVNQATSQDFNNDDKKNKDLKTQLKNMQEDLRRRQESYIRRERMYEEKITEKNEEIENLRNGRTDWMEHDEKVR